jgi:opacity protein-like surface antigen
MVFAQNGMYFRGGAGFALGIQKDFIGSEVTWNSQGDITSIKDVYYSAGRGLNINGALGVPVYKNLVILLESGIGLFGGITLEDKRSVSGVGEITEKAEISARHIPILASFIISAGDVGGVRPYAGAGIGIYLYSISTKFTNSFNQSLAKVDNKVKLPIGFQGMIGLEFPLAESMSFFGEFRLVSLGLTESEDKLTELKDEDGNDILDQISAENRVTKYEKDSTENPAPEVFSASSLGVKVGLKLNL